MIDGKTTFTQHLRDEVLRDAFNDARMIAWDWDLTTHRVTFSENAMDLYGVVAGNALELAERIHPDDRTAIKKVVDGCIAGAGPYTAEFRIQMADGSVRWISDRGAAQPGPDGKTFRLSGISIDVTARKQAQWQLKHYEEQLLLADKHKEEFMAMLAHELRNPLAPLRNGLYLLEQPNLSTEQTQKTHAMMRRQFSHLTRIVDDLLDVARVARQRIMLQKTRVNLTDVLRGLAEDCQHDFARIGTRFIQDLPSEPLWVMGDATRLHQIVGNLLNNAFKFTSATDTVTLSARPDVANGQAIITVHDTGAGIDPALLATMFEPFMQASQGVDRSKGGLGLGLTLVKGLVELHGGLVSASSEGVGRGSTFTVKLPLLKEGIVMSETPEFHDASTTRRILIIEDNTDAAETMKILLEMSGHTVNVAYSGQEGIEKARQQEPEIIICDIGLPGGLDGYDVAKTLRNESSLKKSTFIALTGYGQTEDRQRAADAGFHTHLTKPVDPAMLETLITRIPACAH